MSRVNNIDFFNSFSEDSHLVDLPLNGRRFTLYSRDELSMSGRIGFLFVERAEFMLV